MDFVMDMLFIKYRGIEINTNNWRYGNFLRLNNNTGGLDFFIVDEQSNKYKIYPTSLGMGSDEKDIHGNEIFVGDKVRQTIINEKGEKRSWDLWVSFNWGTFWLGSSTLASIASQVNKPKLEIIGNRITL